MSASSHTPAAGEVGMAASLAAKEREWPAKIILGGFSNELHPAGERRPLPGF